MIKFDISKNNDAWIIHHEEVNTAKDGLCNVYVLLDAFSGYCFGVETVQDLPTKSRMLAELKQAKSKSGIPMINESACILRLAGSKYCPWNNLI